MIFWMKYFIGILELIFFLLMGKVWSEKVHDIDYWKMKSGAKPPFSVSGNSSIMENKDSTNRTAKGHEEQEDPKTRSHIKTPKGGENTLRQKTKTS